MSTRGRRSSSWGSNGSGKTTTLRSLLSAFKPTAGTCTSAGESSNPVMVCGLIPRRSWRSYCYCRGLDADNEDSVNLSGAPRAKSKSVDIVHTLGAGSALTVFELLRIQHVFAGSQCL